MTFLVVSKGALKIFLILINYTQTTVTLLIQDEGADMPKDLDRQEGATLAVMPEGESEGSDCESEGFEKFDQKYCQIEAVVKKLQGMGEFLHMLNHIPAFGYWVENNGFSSVYEGFIQPCCDIVAKMSIPEAYTDKYGSNERQKLFLDALDALYTGKDAIICCLLDWDDNLLGFLAENLKQLDAPAEKWQGASVATTRKRQRSFEDQRSDTSASDDSLAAAVKRVCLVSANENAFFAQSGKEDPMVVPIQQGMKSLVLGGLPVSQS